MNDYTNENAYDFYNSSPADKRYVCLADNGTELTSDQHEACKMLCVCRNFYIMDPDIIYYHTAISHISNIEQHINDFLNDAELPTINLNGIPDDLLTTKDFAHSKIICRNGEIFTPQKARHIAAKHTFEEIKIIQKYLYEIDKKFGTCYLDINLPTPDVDNKRQADFENRRFINKYLYTLFVDEIICKENIPSNI